MVPSVAAKPCSVGGEPGKPGEQPGLDPLDQRPLGLDKRLGAGDADERKAVEGGEALDLGLERDWVDGYTPESTRPVVGFMIRIILGDD
jgi:hypothetical protein